MQATEIQRLAEFEEWYWWHRARQAIVRGVLRRYVTPNANRILDVGCGAGATSLVLNEFGEVLGVDAGALATKAARDRGLQVANMDATRLAARDGMFDVAVALDVLEHLDNDLGAARELLRVLRPGGLLLVTVPAYQSLWSSHDVALGHRRRYRRSAVRRLFAAAGFESITCSYVMSAALPAAAAVRLAERLPFRRNGALNEGDSQSGYVPLPPFANELLSHLVGLDGHLVGRLPVPFGLSVLGLARKPLAASD
jgi:SAM-dependent methyltransferase